ncbi:MAG: hypothetical protein KF889_01685 [Alphaproteobacteria bacterium]|nr:hypothetical protein [Alphaproteobacteria bacterium]MCW5741619.1 hypothetical protein [Alphaproteobacteria bacterium]
MAIDFAAVKAGVSFEEAISFLKLIMKREGEQYRSPCPVCRKGGDRALVVTPSKGFYCHAARKGGDVISFVAHVQECGQRQAAEQLSEHFLEGRVSTAARKGSSRITSESDAPPTDGLQPLDHLTTAHPVIEALQLSETACQAIGMGVAVKGMMRGRLAIPLRLPDGTLCGYLGIATDADMAPLLKFPPNLDERISPKKADDAVRQFLRLAVNNG